MDALERSQFEQASIGEDEAAAQAQAEALKADLHTSIPGKVVSFDADAQTAVVRPGIKRFFRGQGWKTLPDLMDALVQFPGGGGYVLTFPLVAGDECWLVFSERAIDSWFASGGEQVPHDYRMHDLSDACVLPGVRSKPHAVTGFNTSGVELRSLDGTAKVQIDGSKNVRVESGGDVVVQAGGTVKLNANPAANYLTDGVLTGSHPCAYSGAPHGTFGNAQSPSRKVLVG